LGESGELEGHWRLISGFFNDRQHLLQFSEVFEHRYSSLSDGVDNTSLPYSSFFDESLLD
jgi:hypothetical protein